MDIWFKVEPFIFHFGTKDYEKAKEVLKFCSEFGLKKAGIITPKDGKYIIEATSTQYMALPLKTNNKILVDDDYLHLILDRGNKKLERNYEILDRFEMEFLKKFKKEEKIKKEKK
jgi:tRNA(Phe) wybutosine-synthesizing methylase Tyw3